MGDRNGLRVLMGVVMVTALVASGFYTYNLGVARGIAESAQTTAAAPGGVPLVAYWPRPWGFGFGLFPVFPLFFFLFWVLAARGLFWRRGPWGRGCRSDGMPAALDEWHARAHASQVPPQKSEGHV